MFRRKTHLERLAEREEAAEFDPRYDDDTGGVMGFVRDRGVRETFESILIAILLALLFRNFLGEAYIIPTGSMAPSLQGTHIDLECEKCGYQYMAGASVENRFPGMPYGEVVATACPICRYTTKLERSKRRDHRSFAGDKILVNKFIYDFQSPERWDVIVFKYPNNGKQNYIKRCVGVPGDGLLIEFGDIYTYDLDTETFADRKIQRKDHRKLKAMLQLVDDTHFVADELKEMGWPSRWQQWDDSNPTWQIDDAGDEVRFANENETDEIAWLRYRHARPRFTRTQKTVESADQRVRETVNVMIDDWEKISLGQKPDWLKDYKGQLINDHYAYNEVMISGKQARSTIGMFGQHWVGDLGVECDFEVESPTGTLAFDVVEGGVHFTCSIDIQSGKATLTTSGQNEQVRFIDDEGDEVTESPSGQTEISGAGSYQVRFVNADDRLYLWVDDRPVEFSASCYRRENNVLPKWTEQDPLDAEPVGIGIANAKITANRIKVLRDVYYVSGNKDVGFTDISSEYTGIPNLTVKKIRETMRAPESWTTEKSKALFDARKRDESWVFKLERYPDAPSQDEFLPMGDNSPQSSDARIWNGPAHVDREYLLGRAMYIYWPHAKTKPLPFWPNFERMKFIR